MKHIKKIHKAIALIPILLLSSFTILESNQEKVLIIGTWNYVNEPNNKWIFTNDKCSWEFNGDLIDVFTYQITEETATNGVVFSYLKLVNINDSNDSYNYEINALNEHDLALDYLGNLNESLMLFEKTSKSFLENEGDFSFETTPPFTIASATYKSWVGGQPGVSGTIVTLDLNKNGNAISLDTLYFREMENTRFEQDSNNPNTYRVHYNTSTRGAPILVLPNSEPESAVEEPVFPFDLQSNEAVLEYTFNGKRKCFKITNIQAE